MNETHQWIAEARYKGSGKHPKYPNMGLDRIHMDQGFIFATDSLIMRFIRGAPEGVSASLTYEEFLTWSLTGVLSNSTPLLIDKYWKEKWLEFFLARPHPGYKVSIHDSDGIQIKATGDE